MIRVKKNGPLLFIILFIWIIKVVVVLNHESLIYRMEFVKIMIENRAFYTLFYMFIIVIFDIDTFLIY